MLKSEEKAYVYRWHLMAESSLGDRAVKKRPRSINSVKKRRKSVSLAPALNGKQFIKGPSDEENARSISSVKK